MILVNYRYNNDRATRTIDKTMGFNLNGINLVFRQHAASMYGFVHQFVSLFVKKIFLATSKQGRRLGFGMLTALTNIRSS